MSYGAGDIYYIAILAVIFLAVDGLWLYAMKDLFGGMIRRIQSSDVSIRPIPALATYMVMTLGLYHFIIKKRQSPWQAVILGFFAYAIYEGTNYSIFNDWDIRVAVYDSLWGGTLFGIVTYVFYLIHDA